MKNASGFGFTVESTAVVSLWSSKEVSQAQVALSWALERGWHLYGKKWEKRGRDSVKEPCFCHLPITIFNLGMIMFLFFFLVCSSVLYLYVTNLLIKTTDM